MANKSVAGPAAAAMTPLLRVFYLLVAVGVFLLDRLTKLVIESAVMLYDTRTVIPGFFQIVHAKNTGIAFGLFADAPASTRTFVLVFLSGLALAGVGALWWASNPVSGRACTALSLILGGALGNLFDRVRYGGVVDFLDFHVGSYHWPAFNVADSAIVVGGGLLLWRMARDGK